MKFSDWVCVRNHVAAIARCLPGITAFWLILGGSAPSVAQEGCRETREFVLCFDTDWLRYYNQLDSEFDWRNYLQEETPRQPDDYYNDIKLIYREVLGREADVDGLIHWSDILATGMELSQVRVLIANSPEALAKIDGIYQEVLKRTVDESGLQTWVRKLGQGSTLAEIREEIESSPEAAEKNR